MVKFLSFKRVYKSIKSIFLIYIFLNFKVYKKESSSYNHRPSTSYSSSQYRPSYTEYQRYPSSSGRSAYIDTNNNYRVDSYRKPVDTYYQESILNNYPKAYLAL